MHKTVALALELVDSLRQRLDNLGSIDRVVCPPFTALHPVADRLSESAIAVGAQDLYWEESGAFTGEISPVMLAELCQYVIIGHSERRTYFGEADETVARKVKAALDYNLRPIVCVGETLDERQNGQTEQVVRREIVQGLGGLDLRQIARLVIAYEPIWAIGTGRASSPDDASQVIGSIIRPTLEELYGPDLAQSIQVLYGGSVKPANAADFFIQTEIDGALVGGASLTPESFIAIAQAAAV
jgi:triosephosphate isomerase